ncbi:MAG: GntR family transcriptional regulator [Acidimicrobiales bacterium]
MVTVDRQLHRLRRRYGTAETIADELRADILRGDAPEGDLLPKLDELTARFSASKLTIRDALRILETEGLVSVQRGNVGGAIAHLPTSGNVAYTLSLVFEGREVTVDEVAGSIERLEPVCAEMCAERPNRASTVLPLLSAAQSQLSDAITSGDKDGARRAARRWHEVLVNQCGNNATAITVGAMQAIWSSHIHSIAVEETAKGLDMPDAVMRQTYAEHAEIQEFIEAGDAIRAGQALRAHTRTVRPGVAVVTYSGQTHERPARIHVARTRDRLAR